MADTYRQLEKFIQKIKILFNKGKQQISEKGGKIVSQVVQNMEARADAQGNGKQADWQEKKSK